MVFAMLFGTTLVSMAESQRIQGTYDEGRGSLKGSQTTLLGNVNVKNIDWQIITHKLVIDRNPDTQQLVKLSATKQIDSTGLSIFKLFNTQSGTIEVKGEEIVYDTVTQQVTSKGQAQITLIETEETISCDHIDYNLTTQDFNTQSLESGKQCTSFLFL